MEELELRFLIACSELVAQRRPLIDDLAAQLNVSRNELFYLWAERKCKQRGFFRDGQWSYFFHGYEADLRHADDGLFLRVDFGLVHTRVTHCGGWGRRPMGITPRGDTRFMLPSTSQF